MTRRVLLGVVGWLAALVAATFVGMAAIGVLEDGITGSQARTLDRDGVRQALSSPAVRSTPTVTAQPSAGSGTPSPQGEEIKRVLPTAGGTVTAACSGGLARLVAWSPGQGFGADDEERGPAPEVSLKFESDDAEYEITVTCQADGPTAHTQEDDGHRGRGRGRD